MECQLRVREKLELLHPMLSKVTQLLTSVYNYGSQPRTSKQASSFDLFNLMQLTSYLCVLQLS